MYAHRLDHFPALREILEGAPERLGLLAVCRGLHDLRGALYRFELFFLYINPELGVRAVHAAHDVADLHSAIRIVVQEGEDDVP